MSLCSQPSVKVGRSNGGQEAATAPGLPPPRLRMRIADAHTGGSRTHMMAVVMVSLLRLRKKGPDSTLRGTNRVLWAAADHNEDRTFGFPLYGCSRPKSVIERPNRPIPEADVRRRMAPAAARPCTPFVWKLQSFQSGRRCAQLSAGEPAPFTGVCIAIRVVAALSGLLVVLAHAEAVPAKQCGPATAWERLPAARHRVVPVHRRNKPLASQPPTPCRAQSRR
jgi:hypothetical protein